MYKIHLDNLLFFAHHGLHDEEQIAGTHFEVSVQLDFNTEQPVEKLSQTIDYTEIYKIIQQHMREPVALLEKLAGKMADTIYEYDNRIHTIYIRIKKLQPPIANFSGNVSVVITKTYK